MFFVMLTDRQSGRTVVVPKRFRDTAADTVVPVDEPAGVVGAAVSKVRSKKQKPNKATPAHFVSDVVKQKRLQPPPGAAVTGKLPVNEQRQEAASAAAIDQHASADNPSVDDEVDEPLAVQMERAKEKAANDDVQSQSADDIDELKHDVDGDAAAGATARFGGDRDIALLNAMFLYKPHVAKKGKAGAAWVKVAEYVHNLHRDMPLQQRAYKDRWQKRLRAYWATKKWTQSNLSCESKDVRYIVDH